MVLFYCWHVLCSTGCVSDNFRFINVLFKLIIGELSYYHAEFRALFIIKYHLALTRRKKTVALSQSTYYLSIFVPYQVNSGVNKLYCSFYINEPNRE